MKAECLKRDRGSAGIAAEVLRKLEKTFKLKPEQEVEGIQAYVRLLRSRGFGVALHFADANSLRLQVLGIARKRHYAVQKKYGEPPAPHTSKDRPPPPSPPSPHSFTVDVNATRNDHNPRPH